MQHESDELSQERDSTNAQAATGTQTKREERSENNAGDEKRRAAQQAGRNMVATDKKRDTERTISKKGRMQQ